MVEDWDIQFLIYSRYVLNIYWRQWVFWHNCNGNRFRGWDSLRLGSVEKKKCWTQLLHSNATQPHPLDWFSDFDELDTKRYKWGRIYELVSDTVDLIIHTILLFSFYKFSYYSINLTRKPKNKEYYSMVVSGDEGYHFCMASKTVKKTHRLGHSVHQAQGYPGRASSKQILTEIENAGAIFLKQFISVNLWTIVENSCKYGGWKLLILFANV